MGIELNRIYNEDCVEGMKRMCDGSVDLIIADPPYGMNFRSNFRKQRFDAITNDNVVLTDWIDEAYRLLKDGGAMYCYTRWDVYPKWYELIADKFNVKNVIVWYKRGGGLGDLKGAYIFNHEFIIYAVKGRHVLNGKRVNDVWEIAKDAPSTYVHPTQKPIQLAETIIAKSSNASDIVLVPFVGSGSDCIAAIRTGRQFIGFELECEYYDIANERIAKEYESQLSA